jgi:hypothetical protein
MSLIRTGASFGGCALSGLGSTRRPRCSASRRKASPDLACRRRRDPWLRKVGNVILWAGQRSGDGGETWKSSGASSAATLGAASAAPGQAKPPAFVALPALSGRSRCCSARSWKDCKDCSWDRSRNGPPVRRRSGEIDALDARKFLANANDPMKFEQLKLTLAPGSLRGVSASGGPSSGRPNDSGRKGTAGRARIRNAKQFLPPNRNQCYTVSCRRTTDRNRCGCCEKGKGYIAQTV